MQFVTEFKVVIMNIITSLEGGGKLTYWIDLRDEHPHSFNISWPQVLLLSTPKIASSSQKPKQKEEKGLNRSLNSDYEKKDGSYLFIYRSLQMQQ